MKKLFLYTMFLGLLAGPLSAQLHISPKVGVSFSSFSEDLEIDTDFKQEHQVGWSAGMDFRIYSSSFMFIPGLYYHALTTEMTSIDASPGTPTISEESTIHMLRVPLSVGFWLTGAEKEGLLSVYIRGGFTPGFVAGFKEPDNFEFDKGDINSFNLAWNAGAGVDIAIFTVEIMYEGGITDFYDVGGDKNNMWVITAGLAF